MEQLKRTELLQELQKIMQDIIAETEGDVKSYDKITQEVNKAISDIKNFKDNCSDSQWKMFRVYLELL